MFSKKIYALTHFNVKAAQLLQKMREQGYDIELLDLQAGFGDLVIEDGSVLIDIRYADGLEVNAKTILEGPQKNYVLVVLNDRYAAPRELSDGNIHYLGHPKSFRSDFVIQKLDVVIPKWADEFKMVETQVELETNKA